MMNKCQELGHLYRLGLKDGEPAFGCVNGCGDAALLKDLPREEIIILVREHFESHDCFPKEFFPAEISNVDSEDDWWGSE